MKKHYFIQMHMRLKWLLMLLPLLLVLMQLSAQAQIVNPELNYSGTVPSNNLSPTGAVPDGWSAVTGTTPDEENMDNLSGTSGQITWHKTPSSLFPASVTKIVIGSTYIYQGEPESFKQTVSGLTAGTTYKLSFLAAGNYPSSVSVPAGTKVTLNLYMDGVLVSTGPAMDIDAPAAVLNTLTFTPASSSVTITIKPTSFPNGLSAPWWMIGNGSGSLCVTPPTPTLSAVTQPTCSVATGSFTISNYDAAATYTISPAGATRSGNTITGTAGTYTVTATSGTCVSTASASRTINAQPAAVTIGTQPANQTVCINATTTFSVAATGTGLTYQWFVDNGSGWYNLGTASTGGGANYSGAQSANLVVTPLNASWTGYKFQVIVTGTGGCTATSNGLATLTVNAPPAITAQPANQTVCLNTEATFATTATGAGLTYQWFVNPGSGWINLGAGSTDGNAAVTGAQTATMHITPLSMGWNNYKFQVIVTGTCAPAATSDGLATLVISTPITPTISAGNAVNLCPLITANILTKVSSTLPAGSTLEFYTSNTPIAANLVTTPTTVGAGTYFAFYRSASGCYSPASAVITVNITTCVVAIPDLTPNILVSPAGIIGVSTATLTLRTVEISGNATSGLITMNLRTNTSYTLNVAVGTVTNGWTYTGVSGVNHKFTSSVVISNSNSQCQVPITFDPSGVEGQFTFTLGIASGSGGEVNIVNNSDQETISYEP